MCAWHQDHSQKNNDRNTHTHTPYLCPYYLVYIDRVVNMKRARVQRNDPGAMTDYYSLKSQITDSNHLIHNMSQSIC